LKKLEKGKKQDSALTGLLLTGFLLTAY